MKDKKQEETMKKKRIKIKVDVCKHCNKPRRDHIYPEWDVHHVKYMNEMRRLA